ncbi:MAG TPA: octanoyltransferase, partial [Gammaproteobacteria bacterium]|nr:octanoyltransferase [Gammaproteobacteria bacterium]
YTPVWHAMKWFNEHRDVASADEFWLVTHPPVFTLGQAGKREHILSQSFIPIVQTDRGGQVTYHGPGQIVLYTLIDIRRLKLGVRQLVTHLETAVIELLGQYGIDSAARADAPGVYIDGRKVASLGLRIRRGCSYHGLALNVEMDLSPYTLINPCGYAGLQVTQLVDEGVVAEQHTLEEQLVAKLADQLGYHCTRIETGLPSLEGLV